MAPSFTSIDATKRYLLTDVLNRRCRCAAVSTRALQARARSIMTIYLMLCAQRSHIGGTHGLPRCAVTRSVQTCTAGRAPVCDMAHRMHTRAYALTREEGIRVDVEGTDTQELVAFPEVFCEHITQTAKPRVLISSCFGGALVCVFETSAISYCTIV